MFFRGHTNAEIARVIRCDERTVQRWFNSDGEN
ncbi:helix-turn-helix domain-containing protein [Roseibium album]